MKNLEIGAQTVEASFTNSIQKMEERLSDTEDLTEEIDTSVKKKTLNLKKLNTKHLGNTRQYEKNKPKNNNYT